MIWEDEEEYPAWRRRWYVLHVKPRAEKKVALHLKAYGFFCHLPTFERVRKVQRRKVRTEIPVFPGYVFTRLLPDERIAVLRTNLVVKTIFVKYPRTMIHQLRQIAKAFTRIDDFKVSSLYKSGDLWQGSKDMCAESAPKRRFASMSRCLVRLWSCRFLRRMSKKSEKLVLLTEKWYN